MSLTADEILTLWRQSSAEFDQLPANLTIKTARLSARPWPDLIDALLALRGKYGSTWVDARERTCPSRSLPLAALALARDAAAAPALYARHWFRTRRLLSAKHRPYRPRLDRSALYLRLDHSFDVKGGGSIAHTVGVIGGLASLMPPPHVVSTDTLPLLPDTVRFTELTPEYGLSSNVPALPLFNYTDQVVAWCRAMISEPPGFIYARYSKGNYAPPLLRNILRAPYVCEFNSPVSWVARNWDKRKLRFARLFQQVEDANLHCADLVVTVSDVNKETLLSRGIPESKILVNPNGVDPALYRPDIDGSEVRRRLGIAPSETVIGFIGTFGPWHGAEILATAFGALLNRRIREPSDLRLLMVGDGRNLASTIEAIEAAGASERVITTGAIPQTEGPAYLAACDILVSPHVPNPDGSRFFGSPTKLFEYMAMGKPIVASNLEQIGEVLDHGKSAWLVTPDDPEALAEGLAILLEDEQLRRRLGAAAREEAMRKYTWQLHVERLLKRLAELGA